MKAALSATKIASFEPTTKPYEVHDSRVPGLLVRVQPSGYKVWYLLFGRGLRLRLGPTAFMTPAQARANATEHLARALQGEDPRAEKRNPSITYKEFVETIYRPWAEVHLKRPEINLRRLHRRFAKLRNKSLNQITLLDVERWRSARLREGRTAVTVNRDTDSIKALLNKARLWGYLDQNPLAELRRLRVDRSPRVRYLTKEEESQLREALIEREARICVERDSANAWRAARNYALLPDLKDHVFADHLRAMVLLSINTGMRQGEVFSLRWDDVDFTRAVATIRGETAKSGQTRHLPLNDEALATLRAWRMQTDKAQGLVFPGREGALRNNVHKSWRGVLDAAGIEGFRWHDLRHHFASRLVMVGVDLNTVRELLGHATYQMTLRYAHLAPDHKADAVAKLVDQAGQTLLGADPKSASQEPTLTALPVRRLVHNSFPAS